MLYGNCHATLIENYIENLKRPSGKFHFLEFYITDKFLFSKFKAKMDKFSLLLVDLTMNFRN